MVQRVNRRDFLKLAGAGAASLALPGLSFASADKSRPNVLFIAVDDLNDWIEPMGGHPQALTPNMSRLAERSVVFTNAQCPAPLCNASRAAVMTGLRPHTTGVYSNRNPWRWASPDAVTLPQHFMNNGYHVAGAGKITDFRFPDPPSWHEYYPDKINTAPKTAQPPKGSRPLNGIENTGGFDWGPIDAPDEAMGDFKTASWIGDQLHSSHDKPFFLAAGIFRPHLPWFAPQKYFDMFPLDKIILPEIKKGDLDDVPIEGRQIAKADGDHRNIIKTDNWHRAVQAYLANTTFADAAVGRILDALESSPYADNTYVVLWGDHGWHLGEKLHWRKFTLWEEACRSPLMIAGPGIKAGRCSKPVNLVDMYPTLAEMCGLPEKPELEAQSITPLLANNSATWEQPSLTTFYPGSHSLRSERWRYTRYYKGGEELYDHSSDSNEWTNLANDPAYDHIKADMAKWLPKHKAEIIEEKPVDQRFVIGPRPTTQPAKTEKK